MIKSVVAGASLAMQRQWEEADDMVHQLEDEKVDIEEKVMDLEEDMEDKEQEWKIREQGYLSSIHESEMELDRLKVAWGVSEAHERALEEELSKEQEKVERLRQDKKQAEHEVRLLRIEVLP